VGSALVESEAVVQLGLAGHLRTRMFLITCQRRTQGVRLQRIDHDIAVVRVGQMGLMRSV
jgi:hypothetical protein